MCHASCITFIEKYLSPDKITNKNILEVGSLDVNGSPQAYVKSHNPATYIGIDLVPGKGVDEVCDVSNLFDKYKPASFDVVICMEMMEHAEDWKTAINNMKEALKVGGIFILTARSPGFAYHPYPEDFWRFTKDNFSDMNKDFDSVIIEDDPEAPGAFFYGVKTDRERVNLDTITVITAPDHLPGIQKICGTDPPFKAYDPKTKEYFWYDPILSQDITHGIGSSYRELFTTEVYNHPKCNVRKGDVVLDIGANWGMFVKYANARGAKVIYAYEPEPMNFNCLMNNKTDNCIPHNNAVGNREKDIDFYFDTTSTGGHTCIRRGKENNEVLKVKCVGINDIMDKLEHVDFLKIDTEGSEYDILYFMSEENLMKVNRISFEDHAFLFSDGNAKRDAIINRLSKWFHTHITPYGQNMSMVYMWRKTFDYVIGHTSFVPFTGYAAHARDFFTPLNKHIPVRIRNYAYVPDVSHITEEQNKMLIHQTWTEKPWEVGSPFERKANDKVLNIILMEHNHLYYYEKYIGPKVGFCVWESTKMASHFFDKYNECDQLWVPTEWHRECLINQGASYKKVKVIPEGVDGTTFNPDPPDKVLPEYEDGRFKFLIFGRWDARKATTEMIRCFLEVFSPDEPVDLVMSVDNPYPVDGMNSTQERLAHHGFVDPRIKPMSFVSREDYVKYMKSGHVLLHCSRSEGWGLPACEAIACGTPTIIADWGASPVFAEGITEMVQIKNLVRPNNSYQIDPREDIGVWGEPDFEHLKKIMRDVYENYAQYKERAEYMSVGMRDKFQWENAVKKAMRTIEDMDVSKYYPTKINISTSDDKRDGFMDIKMENCEIPMCADELVDELYSSHYLEHLSKPDVDRTLNEWYRILKKGGKMTIVIPDIEWCMSKFIESGEDNKWDFPINTIFGLQNTTDEYHKTGFTTKRITGLLEKAGFDITNTENIWTHEVQSISVECVKTMSITDEVYIIDSYHDTPEKVDMLKEKIRFIKSMGKDIVLVTHYPALDHITSMVDYVIYDKRNIMADDWKVMYWSVSDEVKVMFPSYRGNNYHAVGCYTSLKNAVDLIKDKYKIAHFVEYDTDLVALENFLYHSWKYLRKGKKVIVIPDPTIASMSTVLFSFDVKWMSSVLPEIGSWQEYKEAVPNADLMYETWMCELIKSRKGIEDRQAVELDVPMGIKRDGILHFIISETDDNKLLMFVYNADKDGTHCYEVYHDDVLCKSGSINYGSLGMVYFPIDKKGTISCYENGKLSIEYVIDPKKLYVDAKFKFKDDKYKCFEWNQSDSIGFIDEPIRKLISFHNGAKAELIGTLDDNEKYDVEFKDLDSSMVIHKDTIELNHWTKTSRTYYTNWGITVRKHSDGSLLGEYKFDVEGKKVFITMGSKAIGDNVGWMPYADEFRKKHNCTVYFSSFFNWMFEKEYPELHFVEPGSKVDDIYALYELGCWDSDYNRNRNHWRTIPLQQIATDILGLEFKEVKAKITVTEHKRPTKGKYIVISEHTTFQSKYWNNPDGWQGIVDYYAKKGYKTVVIGNKPTKLKRVIDKINVPLQESIYIISKASLFGGVSTGPTWIAWSLGVPTVLVCGCSREHQAMLSDHVRVRNGAVCNGCHGDIGFVFDRGNWMMCPKNNHFICTTSITPEFAIKKIEEKYKL